MAGHAGMGKNGMTHINLDDIRSNNIKRCAICGIPITPDNDSGWEVFVEEGRKTQPICGWCEAQPIIKPEDTPKNDSEEKSQ